MFGKKTGTLLLLLVFLYSSQGVLYQGGNFLTQIILVAILSLSCFYLIKTLTSFKRIPKILKYWTLLLSLNILGFILTGSLEDRVHFGMFRGILISLLTIFPFYYLSRKGLIREKYLIIFFLGFTPVLMLNWIREKTQQFAEFGKEEIVNNVSYSLILLIPFLFLFEKRKFITNALLFLIMYFVILGSKRGAIIVGGISVLFYLYYRVKFANFNKNIFNYIFGFASLFGILIYGYRFFLQNDHLIYRFEQLQEGESSGRDEIYANIFSNWSNSENLVNIFFGYGFAGSLELSGQGLAHNDWLELLSNFGLIGVGIYLLFFYHAFKYAFKVKIHSQYKLMLLCILTMWLATSFFSMGYVSNDGYLRSILLGYILGMTNLKRPFNSPEVLLSPRSKTATTIDNNSQMLQ